MDLHALRYRHDIVELEPHELTSRTIRFAVKSPYQTHERKKRLLAFDLKGKSLIMARDLHIVLLYNYTTTSDLMNSIGFGFTMSILIALPQCECLYQKISF